MNLESILPQYNDEIKLCAAFLTSFIITYFSIPIVVKVSLAKRLFDIPNGRTSHKHATPTLGGIAMFAGVLISSLLFVDSSEVSVFQYVIAGSFILFFFGIQDDLTPLKWRMKIFGEVLAAFSLIVLADFRITDLQGILGIHHIDYLSSTILTLFVMIGIVNAMNLIDGIDGLAAGISFMATCIFGLWFFMTGQGALAILSISVTGMLIAYLGYNVYGIKNKIFMGDTGALLLGYLMTIFVIALNRYPIAAESPWHINNVPVISFSILFIPFFDTLRVMTSRMIKGKSPFTADHNHIHHQILDLGFSHGQTTLILLLTNGLIILLVFMLQNLEIHLLMLVVLSLGIIKSLIPAYIGRHWHYQKQKILPTFKNVSKKVAKSIKQTDIRMRN